jgi:LemA protein
MKIAVIIAVVVVLLLVAFILIRNNIVRLSTKVGEAWGDIDAQLTRRHDLVPNLVTVVKGYATHEADVLEEVTRAREQAVTVKGPAEATKVEPRLTTAIGSVLARAENYPDLKAAANFQQLQAELSNLEDEIQAARRIYNSNVQIYNAAILTFPNLLVAKPSGFRPRAFFESGSPEEREPSNVQLG